MQGTNSTSLEQQDGGLQDVLIVGGGVAGLATALAFHRMGFKPLVLESADHLRSPGAGIGLWRNAWKALEALGVSDYLDKKFDKIFRVDIFAADGNSITSLPLKEEFTIRAADRKILIEALSEPLPNGTIIFNARVSNIRKLTEGYTEVECANGLKLRTKVLIGCDGVGSVVAKWLGLKKPQYSGYTATRGRAIFPEGHNLKPVFQQIVGKGVRVGISPITDKSAYWFVSFNNPKGNRIYEPELIREEALTHVRGFADPFISEAIKRSPLESLARRDVADRWTWPGLIWVTPLYKGGVSLAGDALHPMTPGLAQGGSTALEDAVILGRHLGSALLMSKEQNLDTRSEMELIENALKTYTQERWPRTLGITIQANIIGAVMQAENSLFVAIRNALLPRLMDADHFADHTLFDCGTLPHVNYSPNDIL